MVNLFVGLDYVFSNELIFKDGVLDDVKINVDLKKMKVAKGYEKLLPSKVKANKDGNKILRNKFANFNTRNGIL